MLLEQFKQDEQFNLLKQEVEAQQAEFNGIQSKIAEIKENVQRNIKMIEALKSENEELQSKIEQMQVSETGVIDFTNFDDYSNEINSNNRKIHAIENIVAKFEKQVELLLLTDYNQADQKSTAKYQQLCSYMFDYGIHRLLSEDFISELNILFKCFKSSSDMVTATMSNLEEMFIATLKQHIQPKLQDVSLEPLGISSHSKQFNVATISSWEQRKLINNLTQ